ncbi:MAG: YraN family protein [bacterium]|nr:YraN family protein [bacterium]
MNKTGMLGEDLACSFLVGQGFKILTRNFRIPLGEIDIIARDRDELVFVEVKTRTSQTYGYAEESVGYQKIRKILRAIRAYVSRYSYEGAYRIDVVSVELLTGVQHPVIRHIRAVELA